MSLPDPADLQPWHQDQWRQLHEARAAGRLPHALLLTGTEGLGKARFAHQLAQALNCRTPSPAGLGCGACRDCRLTLAGVHPDVIVVEPEKRGGQLTIDMMRDLIARVVLTPEAGRLRVIVIAPAEAMNAHAANALLKTLEEPAPATLFVLVSSRPARLPATLRSRCQAVRFRPPGEDALANWLAQQDRSEDLRALLPLHGGAPMSAAAALEEGAGEDLARFGESMSALVGGTATPAAIAHQWAGCDPDWWLSLCWHWLADLVRLKHCARPPLVSQPGWFDALSPIARRVDLAGAHRLLGLVEQMRRGLRYNLNPQMMMERLLIDWQKLSENGS